MSTVAIKRTPVEAKWNTQKIQEAAARAFAVNNMAAMAVISKQGENAILEFQHMVHEQQLKHLKTLGVKNPLDLVKAKAEFEANVFGSKIDIEGDENCAHLIYNECAMWNAMQKIGNLTPEQQEKMGKTFGMCVSNFAKEWGFTGEVKMDGECCTVTFRK